MRDFIYNFTHKQLKRSLRTHVEDAPHTHYFGSDGGVGQEGTNDTTVSIMDLTTRSFRKIVRTPGTVSIFRNFKVNLLTFLTALNMQLP